MTDQTWNSLLRDQLAWPLTHQPRDRFDGDLHLHAHQQTRRVAS